MTNEAAQEISRTLDMIRETLGEIAAETPTLRDYFAAHALAGLLADDMIPEFAPAEAYKVADLMLAERVKPRNADGAR